MKEAWERDRAAVRGFVERVAADYGAASIAVDADLGDGVGGSPEARVALPGQAATNAETVDLVVSVDAPARAARWEEYLVVLAKRARKVLVVVAGNAERLGRRRGPGTTAVACVLWSTGRVREHAYLGLPRLIAPPTEILPAPARALVRWTARWHVFVVDTAPRTPQARRRLLTDEATLRGPMRTT